MVGGVWQLWLWGWSVWLPSVADGTPAGWMAVSSPLWGRSTWWDVTIYLETFSGPCGGLLEASCALSAGRELTPCDSPRDWWKRRDEREKLYTGSCWWAARLRESKSAKPMQDWSPVMLLPIWRVFWKELDGHFKQVLFGKWTATEPQWMVSILVQMVVEMRSITFSMWHVNINIYSIL